MYDNTLYLSKIAEKKSNILKKLNVNEKDFLLATVHRDYNTDNEKALIEILKAFNYITTKHNLNIIFPIHPHTLKIIKSLSGIKEVDLFLNNQLIYQIEPVSFLDMILLEKYATLILRDSGGVQKEAYFFNKPCIILRTETEWIEIMETKKAILTGSSFEKIISTFNSLIRIKETVFPKIFGSGNTAELICKELINSKLD